MKDKYNPNHYKWHPLIECVDVIEHFPYNLASAIKYIWRCGRKDNESYEDDLKKAIWFIEREIRFRGLNVNKGELDVGGNVVEPYEYLGNADDEPLTCIGYY